MWYELIAPKIGPEFEITQRNDFQLDEHELSEIVAREFVQNALDARSAMDAVVRVRMRLVPRLSDPQYLSGLLEPLRPHTDACRIEWDAHRPPAALILEDFGTTGLAGAVDRMEDAGVPWSDFWWRFGRSGKTGAKQGRNGLGRISYAVASEASAFFVLTRRRGEGGSLLKGMALLNLRTVRGKRLKPLMYWGKSRIGEEGVRPYGDADAESVRFRKAFGVEREEPGVTVIIPLPAVSDAGGWREGMIRHIVTNQFPAILKGKLALEIGGEAIGPANLEKYLPAGERGFLNFVRQALGRPDGLPTVTLREDWHEAGELKPEHLAGEQAEALAARPGAGGILRVIAPLEVRRRLGGRRSEPEDGRITAFLRRPSDGESRDLFVRDDLAVTDEKHLQGRPLHALIVAEGDCVAELLGDAETPAHTRWRLKSDRLDSKYTNAAAVIRATRRLAREMHDLLFGRREERDVNALLHFFARPAGAARRAGEGETVSRPELPPPAREPVVIEPLNGRGEGGFRIRYRPPEGAAETRRLRVTLGYRTVDGTSRYDEGDFTFTGAEALRVEVTPPASWQRGSAPNEVMVTLPPQTAAVSVSGLDPRRNLKVEARILPAEDEDGAEE